MDLAKTMTLTRRGRMYFFWRCSCWISRVFQDDPGGEI